MTTNRHPVDELADVRKQIKTLQKHEQILRDRILSGEYGLIGDEYEAAVAIQRREMLDTKEIKSRLSLEVLSRFVRTLDVTIVKLAKLGSGDSHEWMD